MDAVELVRRRADTLRQLAAQVDDRASVDVGDAALAILIDEIHLSDVVTLEVLVPAAAPWPGEHEHRDRVGLLELFTRELQGATLADPSVVAVQQQLSALLEVHLAHEADDLLPVIERSLGFDERDELGRRIETTLRDGRSRLGRV